MIKYLYTTLFCCLVLATTFGQEQDNTSLQDQYQLQIVQTDEKIRLDGRLEEQIWTSAPSTSPFWMSFPVDDSKVKDELQTSVQMAYDEQNIYFAVTCKGPNDYIIPTLKRDNGAFWTGDVFTILIDPTNESTNGFIFGVNPAGVQVEALVSGRTGTRAEMNSRGGGNSAFNFAWDNKWFSAVQTGVEEWTIEIAIPFKTLRFDPQNTQWGVNFSRGEPRTNAWHTWSPVPVQFLTVDLGYTGALIWDKAPAKVKGNFSLIPYTLGSFDADYEESPTERNYNARVGTDAKVALSSSLNLDLTINPDFSQVDVDQQVTNLTTFNIRFPERRLFFLENSDLFANFGIPPMRPFFSRRIGLDEDGNTIPIEYGARISGSLKKDLRMGLMNLQTRATDEFDRQNYTSFTLQQRVLERSTVQAYFHNRQAMQRPESLGADFNRNYGAEFKYFSRDAKWQAFSGIGFSNSDGVEGDNYFYNIGIGYDTRSINAYWNLAGIGDNYYADMGWIPFSEQYDEVRDTTIHIGLNHSFGRFNYTYYPENQAKINSHQWGLRHVMDLSTSWDLLQSNVFASYIINFANTGSFNLEYSNQTRELLFPFGFTDDDPLPAGRYNYQYIGAEFSSDSRRFFTYTLGTQYGSFFNGDRFQASMRVQYRVQPWGNFGLNFVYNQLEFPEPYGAEDLILIGPRIEINFSKSVFWTTFLQFNTQRDNFNINSRLQWRFSPMSDLFIVYSDNYAIEVWGKKNRALVAKVNYWLNL